MNNPDPNLQDELKAFAFQYFDGGAVLKSDDLTVVIRGHLLVESFLERLLALHMDLSIFDGHEDLTFSRKLKMAHALGLLDDLYPAIKRLNKIRNDFAHDIRSKLCDMDISVLVELFEKKHGGDPIWKATGGDNKLRFGVVIHYLLGKLASLIGASPSSS